MLLRDLFRQKEKKYKNVIKSREDQLKVKDSENLHLKEKLLKIKSEKDKLKDNLEKYRKENK